MRGHPCCAAIPPRHICHEPAAGSQGTAPHSRDPRALSQSCSCASLTREPLLSASSSFPVQLCAALIAAFLPWLHQKKIHRKGSTHTAPAPEGRRTEEALLHQELCVLFFSPRSLQPPSSLSPSYQVAKHIPDETIGGEKQPSFLPYMGRRKPTGNRSHTKMHFLLCYLGSPASITSPKPFCSSLELSRSHTPRVSSSTVPRVSYRPGLQC